MIKNNKEKYYLGLDIGTDSVGYAVIDKRYNLIKYKGEPMWGAHLFDKAEQCDKRRGYRATRRRLDRRQQRVQLVDEIMALEISKIDAGFFTRKKESRLYREDRTNSSEGYLFFNDMDFNDKDYNKKYPTIHHLICDLMDSDEKKDIRLINLALDWLVAHRGHFLNEIGIENVDNITDFYTVYQDVMKYFEMMDMDYPWDKIDERKLEDILKQKTSVNKKKLLLKELLYPNGIKEDENYSLSRKELVNLLAGGKVKASSLFKNSLYEEDISFTISDNMEEVLPQLGDDAELIAKMAAIYDWSLLSDTLAGHKYISQAKIAIYECHANELCKLKKFVKKYKNEKYYEIFKLSSKELKNYVAYSYNTKSVKDKKSLPVNKANKEDFSKYLEKTLNLDSIICDCEEDEIFKNEMKEKLSLRKFLPKQIDSDNRVIPYQLYYVEYKKIIKNSARFYEFFSQKDEEGYSNIDKLESIFEFKIPYYVGPLRTDNGKYGWMKRKIGAKGVIRPWNFEEKIDLDKSEEEFINRMTNTCSYLAGEDVLPKNSILYSKFMVLNEINNIKANGVPISVEAKKTLYNELFSKVKRVTPKRIHECLYCNGFIKKEDIITGIDITIKSSLRAACEFRKLLESNTISISDVEEIIKNCTYTEDKARYKKWLRKNYANISEEDFRYISYLKYKDFGRLSKRLLSGIEGVNLETGEIGTIMHFLWESNDNLMQILSEKYTFTKLIEGHNNNYYSNNPMSIIDRLEDLGISNAVKRPVIRTLDVIDDVVTTMGYAPQKIFIEMARGADEKKGRTVTRKEQILELYKTVDEDIVELKKQLEAMGDNANNMLQRDELFLYYMQLGKCMYSNEPIHLDQLGSSVYNIDHIYPQSLVKDDSVLNNKVLVKSEINGQKSNQLLDANIRNKMTPMWNRLRKYNLITQEKYARLTRTKDFTPDEKMGFINRQLVETRQSTKAVTQMLKSIYPNSEIVYVKAKLAADFRHELMPEKKKSRLVNDLHHAKDAYLNAVVGNVYNERFTKKWFNITDNYSLKTKTLFTNNIVHGREVIWDKDIDLPLVKKIYSKNNIHLTRYSYCRNGELFKQLPVRAGEGLVPLKAGLDTTKYGGYNKATASFFVLVRYQRGKKTELSLVPIELMVRDKFLSDDKFAIDYITDFLNSIGSKKIANAKLMLNKRLIKLKTLISLDGYNVWINGKSNGGKIVTLSNAISLILSDKYVTYIKALENYSEKKKSNKNIKHNPEHDGLSEEGNIELYDELLSKMNNDLYRKMPGSQLETLTDGKSIFISKEFDVQVKLLLTIVESLKTGRTGGFDLGAIGGKGAVGAMCIGANIASSSYESIKLIDYSPAGLHRKESINLKELII